MMLADYITNEDNQAKRFNDRQLGPSTLLRTSLRPCKAHLPSPHWLSRATTPPLQRVGANYWSSAESLGEILASGDTQGQDHPAVGGRCRSRYHRTRNPVK